MKYEIEINEIGYLLSVDDDFYYYLFATKEYPNIKEYEKILSENITSINSNYKIYKILELKTDLDIEFKSVLDEFFENFDNVTSIIVDEINFINKDKHKLVLKGVERGVFKKYEIENKDIINSLLDDAKNTEDIIKLEEILLNILKIIGSNYK